MHDCENEVYSSVVGLFDSISASSRPIQKPSSFPHVSFWMSNNETYGVGKEKFSRCTFMCEVYSAKETGKKQECKEIINTIDDFLTGLNFRRESCVPAPNIDTTIYRLVARYVVITDGEKFYKER